MASLPQISVLVVIFGLQVSSVLGLVWCTDNYGPGYWCNSNQYCCGISSCCTYTLRLPTDAIIGITVGSVIFGIALISGIIWLCCVCCKPPRTAGRVVTIPPQYVQQPYLVNTQYEVMAQQPYPTQVQYPANPPQQPVAYIPPADYEQQRRPERPRRHHSIPRAQY